jgi:hypothetical protein
MKECTRRFLPRVVSFSLFSNTHAFDAARFDLMADSLSK